MMDSWENDWADPFSDEPITSPPSRTARTRTKVPVQSTDEAKISKHPSPNPSEGAAKISPSLETKKDDTPRDVENHDEDDNLKGDSRLESSRNKKKWQRVKRLESQKNRDAGTSKGRKSPPDSKNPLNHKESMSDEMPKKEKDEIEF